MWGNEDHHYDFKPNYRDLDKKNVIVIVPPWFSCGSYAVFKSQVSAYKTLGASVHLVAVGRGLFQRSRARGFWNGYYNATGDVGTEFRYHTGPTRRLFRRSRAVLGFIRAGRFDHAAAATLPAALSPIPPQLLDSVSQVNHIHCNHYFNLPFARALSSHYDRCPIVLDTHDIQAYQFALRGERNFLGRHPSSVNDMINSEIHEMQGVDLLLHVSIDELREFEKRMPKTRHFLLHPHVQAPTIKTQKHALIVGAANYPNFLSIKWFLTSVYPHVGNMQVRIVGDVIHEFQKLDPILLRKHRNLFVGRVANLNEYYEDAAAIALPTVAGHGISIKTIEALGTNLPIIATPHAFRGIAIDFRTIAGVMVTEDAGEFAVALKRACGVQSNSQTVEPYQVFRNLFSFDAYVGRLAKALQSLTEPRPVVAGAKASQPQVGRVIQNLA